MRGASMVRARMLQVLVLVVAMTIGLLAPVGPAAAQDIDMLVLTPTQGRPGKAFTASGCGWADGSTVQVRWSDETLLGSAIASGNRCFSVQVTVPRLARLGSHLVLASSDKGQTAQETFHVIRPRLTLSVGKGLPGTTTDASGCGWVAGSTVTFTWVPTGAQLGTATIPLRGQCLPNTRLTIPSGASVGWGDVRAQAGATARATAPFEVQSAAPTFFPLVQQIELVHIQPLVAQNLRVRGVELTQGIQCFDTSAGLATCSDNSLPLVKEKLASARLHLQYTSPIATTRSNTPVRFHVRLKGSGKPFQTATTQGTAHGTLSQLDTAVPRVNFEVYGGGSSNLVVEYYVEVDPNNVVAETNEGDNRFPASGFAEATFRRTHPLRIEGQRIDYHPSGYTGTRTPSGWAVDGGAATWFRQLLPIDDVTYTLRSGLVDWTTSLGSGSGQHSLIGTLNGQWLARQVWTIAFSGGLPTVRVPSPTPDHLYGWAPNAGYSGGHADMPVYPHQNGWGVVGIGTDRVPASPTTDAPGGGTLILGHELVHDYDVLHTNTSDGCSSNDGNADWPYSSSSIQEVGFNPFTGKVYDPASTHDIMSYCPAGGSQEGWISPFVWQQYYNRLLPRKSNGIRILGSADGAESDATGSPSRVALAEAETDESLIVDATVFNPSGGELNNLERVPVGIDSTGGATEGAYRIQLRDGATVLREAFFDRTFTSEYGDGLEHGHSPDGAPGDGLTGDNPSADVDLVMPFDAGTDNIRLLKGTTVLDTVTVSANPPTVSFTFPAIAGSSLTAGTTPAITWDASDLDGDSLTSTLYYRRDVGEPFVPLGSPGLGVESLSVPVDTLAGGDSAQFKVVVSDGVNTAVATSPVVYVPRKRPVVGMLTPEDGARIPQGGSAVLSGFGTDLEDGQLDGSRLQWSSDRDGALGVGSELTTPPLSAGTHTITLRGIDSDEDQRTTTRTLHVASVGAPVVRLAGDGSAVSRVDEGVPVVVSATFSDPSSGGPYQCVVDHGDGTGAQAGTISGSTCTGPAHAHWLPGVHDVSVRVFDAAGDLGSSVRTFTVDDVAGNDVVRIAGDDRFQTAARISSATFAPGVPEVFIATGTAFPDALSGGPAATRLGAPVLLVSREAVPDATRDELARLGPARVTILGGPVAVSEGVAQQLGALTGAPVRRLEGQDRFETAAKIALDSFAPGVESVTIATGANFADALSGGPPASLRGGPILLVGGEVPAATAEALTALRPAAIDVLGGPVAVSDAVLEALREFTTGEVTRRAGDTRYETSAAISAATYPAATRTVYVATGENFADALAGAPSAVRRGAPMLLVRPGEVPEAVISEIRRIDPERVVILGGPVAVSEAVEARLVSLLAE